METLIDLVLISQFLVIQRLEYFVIRRSRNIQFLCKFRRTSYTGYWIRGQFDGGLSLIISQRDGDAKVLVLSHRMMHWILRELNKKKMSFNTAVRSTRTAATTLQQPTVQWNQLHRTGAECAGGR
jgi:hypothetical protein